MMVAVGSGGRGGARRAAASSYRRREKYLWFVLPAVVVIVDVRRGLEEDDRDLIRFIEESREVSRRPVNVIVVATKLDRLPRNARKIALEAVRKDAGRPVIGFSAETGEGKEPLWAALRRAALGPAPSPEPPG